MQRLMSAMRVSMVNNLASELCDQQLGENKVYGTQYFSYEHGRFYYEVFHSNSAH